MNQEKMLLSFGDNGLSLRWLGDEKLLTVNEGDVFIMKFRNKELLQITVGRFKNITQPVMFEWLSRDIISPQKDMGIICKIYKK